MRVLHLIEPGSPGGGACTLRMLAEPCRRLNSVHQDVLVIGTSGHEALARRCGLAPIGHICPPASVPWAGAGAIRRIALEGARAGRPYDLMHAWTPRAAVLAARAARALPVLGTFHVGPVAGLESILLRACSRNAKVHLLAGSPAVQREYRALGFDAGQLGLLPPAVNPDQDELGHRSAIRARWAKDSGVDPQTFVIGLLCEPVMWPDIRAAAGIAARLRLSGREVRLAVHHSSARRIEAESYLRGVGMEDLIIVDDAIAEPWRIVSGLDAALLWGEAAHGSNADRRSIAPFELWPGAVDAQRIRPMPSVLPLLWAFAAGVPVIAEETDAVWGVVDEGITGLLVKPHDINAATDRVARMFDDRTIAHRIGAAARHAAHDLFHISSYCVRLRHAYELLTAHRGIETLEGMTTWAQGGVAPETIEPVR